MKTRLLLGIIATLTVAAGCSRGGDHAGADDRAAAARAAPPASDDGAGKIPPAEALPFTKALSIIANSDPQSRLYLLATACAEAPGCAGTCKREIAAISNADPASRSPALLDHCDEIKAATSGATGPDYDEKANAWLRQHVQAYTERLKKDGYIHD